MRRLCAGFLLLAIILTGCKVTGVSLNKSATSIAVGGAETLTATISPKLATNKNVTWASSDTSIATVSSGAVTGVAIGTAVITVTTVDGGYTATCTVTVTAPTAVTGVTLNKSSTAIAAGSAETLVATIAPSNATNQNVSWSSSDTSIATVSSGTVTGVAIGSAVITVTTVDGGYTASCTITVTAADLTLGDRTEYSLVTLTAGGTYAKSVSGDTAEYVEYTSTSSDTPAVKVAPGGSLTLTHCKATKSGGATSSTENSGFYGFNSGVLASSSSSKSSYTSSSASSISLTDCTITTSVTGANGAFAFGEKASITLDHVTINTTGSSNARGVDATYGGSITITNSTISTQGGSCAALATDRYTGTAAPSITATNVDGTTVGTGSPGIYCTGTFNVTDCTLTATGSEAAVIEGKNSITLNNSSIAGTQKWGVMIYQSMSGDSSTGTGNFSMTGGMLTNNDASGPLFFVCDTAAVITLDGATLVNSSDMLLLAGKASTASSYISNVNSSWGTLGGTVTFTATNQTLEGNIIICDSASSLDLTLTGSSLKGAINNKNNTCTAKLTIDAGSSWEVTGDSYLTSLTNHGTITGSGRVFVNGTQVY